MPLSNDQIKGLLNFVAEYEPDAIKCDCCFEKVAEFAELKLSGAEIPEAKRKIEIHLRQCPCCRDEYEALLAGIRGLEMA